MMAWSVSTGAPLTPDDHQHIEAALAGRDWVQVFQGVVVLTLANEAERIALQQQLTELSKTQFEGRMIFVISPLMASGTGIYRGLLPQPIWEPLNKKTV